MIPVTPLIERFWPKVDKRGPDECWNWTASVGRNGYGQIGAAGKHGAKLGAHRLSYTIHHGEIEPGLFVCHRCDNKLCCNPAHLFLGTHTENVRDMHAKGRAHSVRVALSDEQLADIRKSSESCVALAKQYGVAHGTIHNIKRGNKHWPTPARSLISATAP